jgi:nitrite reductase/ring-hydroxylating ferredoxin subunit
MARVTVGRVGDLKAGEARVVDAGAATLALCNVDGAYYAVDNACPHRGGPLGDGDLSGAVIACPWHGWRWDVTSGRNVNNPAVRVACFAVTVEGDALVVEVPEAR